MSNENLTKTDVSSIVIDGEAELVFTEDVSKDAGLKAVLLGSPFLLCGFIAGWLGFLSIGFSMFVFYVLVGLYVVHSRCARRFSRVFLSFAIPGLLVSPVMFLDSPPAYVYLLSGSVLTVCLIGIVNVASRGRMYER
jgi:hypothetical protein